LQRKETPTDPVTLAAAVAFVTPYLLDFGKDAAKEAASGAGKSVWGWIKSKLTSRPGRRLSPKRAGQARERKGTGVSVGYSF
jgi:hypothetical protein